MAEVPVPSVPAGPSPDELSSGDFPVLWPVLTRWADNDMFGHLNNAAYYQLFDTAINAWINTRTGLTRSPPPRWASSRSRAVDTSPNCISRKSSWWGWR